MTEDKLRLKLDVLMERFKTDDRGVSEEDVRGLMYCDFYDPKVSSFLRPEGYLDGKVLEEFIFLTIFTYLSTNHLF